MSAKTLSKTKHLAGSEEITSKVLPLPMGFFRIRKNGIEFQSSKPISEWTEMTVELETSATGKKVRCTGVVVACNGNRHSGYQVAMLFTDLSEQSLAQLNTLSASAAL